MKDRGFLDLEYRDEYNIPLFKCKKQPLRKGLSEFERFCINKLGIKPFTTEEIETIEKSWEKKYNIKGVSFK